MSKPTQNAPEHRIELSHELVHSYVERAKQLRNDELGRLLSALFSLPRKLLARLLEAKTVQPGKAREHAHS